MKKFIAFAAFLFLALTPVLADTNPWLAEDNGLSILKAELPTCAAKIEGRSFTVRDCVSVGSCATTATPGFVVRMTCDYTGAAWAWRVVNATIGAADAGDYVPKTVAGQQTIAATGAGNDVTVSATDDVILAPTDAFSVTSGGASSIVTTAGAVTITAGGTTQDVAINSVDDIAEAATDDYTHTGDNFGVATTSITLNPGGSTVELQMAAGVSTFLGQVVLPIASAPPAVCGAGTKASVYYDSDINKVCICNGTNYVLANDDSTTTGCS